MPSQLAEELIQALNEEIETLKDPRGRSRGGNAVKVFNGRFLREISGLNIYLFNLENFLTVLDDSPAEIDVNGQTYPAQILVVQGLEVEIGIERFSGGYIPEAMLRTNSWYLLELLRKKLEDTRASQTKPDFSLSEALFLGNLSPSPTLTQTQASYSLGEHPPNDAQKRAIEASFSSPLAIVWGPPGTGKTTSVARSVEAHLNAGRSVLLVSHANNAVDEALKDIANHLKGSSFYQEGKLVRLGKPQEELLKILESQYPLVLLDKIAEKLGQTLGQERRLLEVERSQIDSALSAIADLILTLSTVHDLSTDLEAVKTSLSQTVRQVDETKANLSQIDDTQERNRRRLLEAQSAGAFKRFLTGLHPDKIQHEIDQVGVRRDSIARALQARTELRKQLEISCNAKETELNQAKTSLHNSLHEMKITEPQIEERKRSNESRAASIMSRIADIDKALEEIQKNVLAEAKLVATTLTKTFTARQFPNRKFDVLILDEASMAPLPHLYWAVGLCSNFVTIVGDFLQLPPICVSESQMARRWLGRSIFDVLSIRNIDEAQNDKRVTLLDTQYRMVPPISEITNRFVYRDKLTNHSSTTRPNLDDGVSLSPLVLVETATINAWCSQLSSGGRFNLYHALVCTTLARKIIQRMPNSMIGIITPYRYQARLINKIAGDWHMLERVRTSTIHTFQGGEQQIIIFDTTEGVGLRTAPMLDDTKRDSDALRVINVAITRAKDKLYLVANTERLLRELDSESLLSRIILHFRQKAEHLGSERLVDNYFTTDFEKWANALLVPTDAGDQPVSGELYTERNFWAQFLQDFKKTKQRLIILSPFVTVKRSGMFMDAFRAMASRGAEVTIYTRPTNQQVGEMASQSQVVLSQLRSIGVSVIERRNMHQKVALIDGDIAWEGSLNILSHRDTGEQMRRFTSESAIEEIIRNLELSKKEAVGDQTQQPCPGPDGNGCRYDGYLVVRQNPARGNKFLGCSSYPKCRYTEPLRYQGNRAR